MSAKAQAKYEQSSKGRDARLRYRQSPKGLRTWAAQQKRNRRHRTELQRRWRQTPAGERNQLGLLAITPESLVESVRLLRVAKKEIST